ncbi:hypothetical protein PV327_010955, partial [Microctonus hyperodae]
MKMNNENRSEINDERRNVEECIRNPEDIVNEIGSIFEDDHIEDENQNDIQEEYEESISERSEEDVPNGEGRNYINIDQRQPLYRGADITVGQNMCSILTLLLKHRLPMTAIEGIIS